LAHTLGMPLAEKLDPVTLSLANAPLGDEPETEEELRAIEACRQSVQAGEPSFTLAELARDWGIDL
jgi:hypothetical protein